jgi:bidirectional [NiFe] hydrogenase diaphorase subunit
MKYALLMPCGGDMHDTGDKKIRFILNGVKVEAQNRASLIDVAAEQGIAIPTLCHHVGLEPYGACRLCTVEMEKRGRTKFVTACNFPVEEGISIKTNSARVKQIRRLIVETLLARCPGVPLLVRLAEEMGIEKPRFVEGSDRCILCGLCVRVCNEIVGANAIGFSGRGVERKVSRPFEIDIERCIGCGACAFICPTDAINEELQAVLRFKETDGAKRWCRYTLMGIAEAALCTNNFQCWRCEIDQRYRDMLKTHPVFAAKDLDMEIVKKYFAELRELNAFDKKSSKK